MHDGSPVLSRSASGLALSYEAAVFLASLPYRRSVYAAGGLFGPAARGQEPGLFVDPGEGSRQALWKFLRCHYKPRELQRAREEARGYRNREPGPNRGFVTVAEPDYPDGLAEIYDPPPVLFYEGEPCWPVAGRPDPGPGEAHAVVGTRRPLSICHIVAESVVAGLACRGPVSIVSGLALGADRLAHLAAVRHGLPGIAVLGAGLDHAGPRANLDIPRRATAAGVPFCLVSEFPPHVPVRPGHFPRRNRIIAGMSRSITVLQAPQKSGAMISARYAMDEGRDVRAFDHPVFEALPGTNEGARSLLDEGADPLPVPELEGRVVEEPEYRPDGGSGLCAWRNFRRDVAAGRLRWLGGRYYLRS